MTLVIGQFAGVGVAEPFGHGGRVSVIGVCISMVPPLDTDDISCLGNMQGLVCLSPLDTHGVSGWCQI